MDPHLENTFLSAFEANKERIFRICRSYAESRDDAKDLFQEVLLNLWKSLPSFKGESALNTWVYRITVNVCLRAKEFSDKKQKHFVRLESIRINNPEEQSDSKEEQLVKLHACIQKLEGVDKSIVLLFLEDLQYKQIADVTGLTENHVAVKIKRIKTKLFNCITT